MQHKKHTIGILGGTFDPVHNGHIQLALTAQTKFSLQEIKFIPCKRPVLKSTAQADVTQRLAMLKMALAPYPDFTIDTQEVQRDTPSYMALTLATLRVDYPDASLALIMGMDVFLELPAWHQWQTLLDYAHIIVISRSGYPITLPDTMEPHQQANYRQHTQLTRFLKAHQTHSLQQITQQQAGFIFIQTADIAPIASSALRHLLQTHTATTDWIPQNVLNYIKKHRLYHQGDNNDNNHR